MFAIKAKIYKVLYNHSSFIAFDETSSIGQSKKVSNFSAFHWSPHGSLVSIGHHFVTTRVVLVTSTFTEKDHNELNYRSGPNHKIGAGRAKLQ